MVKTIIVMNFDLLMSERITRILIVLYLMTYCISVVSLLTNKKIIVRYKRPIYLTPAFSDILNCHCLRGVSNRISACSRFGFSYSDLLGLSKF